MNNQIALLGTILCLFIAAGSAAPVDTNANVEQILKKSLTN
jgi:hypothetical protein